MREVELLIISTGKRWMFGMRVLYEGDVGGVRGRSRRPVPVRARVSPVSPRCVARLLYRLATPECVGGRPGCATCRMVLWLCRDIGAAWVRSHSMVYYEIRRNRDCKCGKVRGRAQPHSGGGQRRPRIAMMDAPIL